eukprot:SAG31_NODE_38727_length_293_cov_10.809278_1_plen_41_part_01
MVKSKFFIYYFDDMSGVRGTQAMRLLGIVVCVIELRAPQST